MLTFTILAVSILAGAGALAGYFLLRRHKHTDKEGKLTQLSGDLLSKEAQAEILIQSITDGIIATDVTGKITLFNKGAAEVTEWKVDEAVGIDAPAVLHLLADEKTNTIVASADHPFMKVLKTRKSVSETVRLVNRQNKQKYISLVISPVILPKNNTLIGTVAVLRDVNAEKNEEKQRADFISTASHEMRTPVAAIEGYLALAMNEKVTRIDAKARDYLEKAHTSTKHLGELFQDLLTSAKAEDGRLTSHPVVTEMGNFVETLTEDLRFGAEKKGLRMELLTNSASPETGGLIDARGKTIQPLYYAHVDPDRLREVITNLFDNAVKYTDEGKISMGITGNSEVVQVRIQDTGHGIPAEDVPHLFQKFYRVDNSATRSVGGTGLGLFICKKIIELYNGAIWAESEPDKGSTFYINIPRLSVQQAHQMQETEKSQAL